MDSFHNSLSKRITTCFSLLLLLLQLFYGGANAKIQPPTVQFNKGFTPLFGDGNLLRSSDDKSVNLLLNQYTGMLSLSLPPSMYVCLYIYMYIFHIHAQKRIISGFLSIFLNLPIS